MRTHALLFLAFAAPALADPPAKVPYAKGLAGVRQRWQGARVKVKDGLLTYRPGATELELHVVERHQTNDRGETTEHRTVYRGLDERATLRELADALRGATHDARYVYGLTRPAQRILEQETDHETHTTRSSLLGVRTAATFRLRDGQVQLWRNDNGTTIELPRGR